MNQGILKLRSRLGHYGYLLTSLLVLLVVQPFFQGVGLRVITQFVTTVVLFSAVYSVHEEKGRFARSLALLVPALLAGWLRFPLKFAALYATADLLMVLFFL